MTKEQALEFVNGEIKRIEQENAGKELRPWERDACPAATEHWRRVQQRIALTTPRGSSSCLDEFDLPVKRPTAKQQIALQQARQKRREGVNPHQRENKRFATE